jgi:glucose/arabinose dehydrogenase
MRIPFPKTLASRAMCLAALAAVVPVSAQVTVTYKNAFGLTFDRPIWFGQMPGVAEKTYVILEQHTGTVVLIKQVGNSWVKSTFLKIDVNQAGEQGLLGIAFHPDYKTNRKYYVSYDTPANYNNVVAEREADETLLKDSGKNRVLLSIPDKYDNHNGGTIGFNPKDPNNFLYFGTGDGGDQNDPDGNGQNKNVLLAKMLRIDVDKKDAGKEYAIPTDNPFAGGGGRGEIYAYGFRNPFKWSFDPFNGDLWVGDVGQGQQEEVDIVAKGANYGWDVMEGTLGTNNGSMSLPVFSYGHGDGNAVIGGVVYRGNPASKYYGNYFTSDNGSKNSWMLKKSATAGAKAASETVNAPPAQLSSYGTDAEGRIYACGIYNGIIYQLDNADLGPNPTSLWHDKEARLARRVLSAAPGELLRDDAFGASASMDVRATDGRAVANISRHVPQVPQGLRPGLYFLKAEGADAGKLLVR